ncbi:YeeE/YedE family protein [Paracoccus spongiarum]|uniref:YeeE/YedE thiosulfate transporter family protein n=1 Tax=Paracoccus spongiarum TaxID=3064387 RepID=A0ABT9J9J6_9RHOB|nr:YeeE/YedE thiosulfate transporter family protein [Paracoccus sp. 2205BS29-5]MDP5306487.1 YeeE/YedE thiosulfate transporter family protein [Paracoccus sp. 2205BS29-5]
MNPDWIAGLVGGLMIGAAAALYLLGNGRIMGASGLLGGLVDGSGRSNRTERAVFIAALIAVPGLLVAAGQAQASAPVAGSGALVLAGLLVGFGTRLANGCTSGHGVCGISRLSRRGIVATLVYLLAGGVAVLLAHALGWTA